MSFSDIYQVVCVFRTEGMEIFNPLLIAPYVYRSAVCCSMPYVCISHF